jgi:hypothetical protein
MNTPDPVGTPVPAMPWYQSKVITALVTIVVTQTVGWATRKWGVNLSVYDLDVPTIVSYAMDGISALAVAVAAKSRAAAAPVTLTQKKADALNAAPTVKPPEDMQ